MPIQMTREEYQEKYGSQPRVVSSAARETQSTDDRPFIFKAADAVTDFVGARGIADTYGTALASIGRSPQEKAMIRADAPSLKETVGSAVETGSMLIPGAGVGASLGRKVGIGALTGYGLDAGSSLQRGESISDALTPGIGTAIGATLPLAGSMLRTAPKALEQASLRMTPVEQQKLSQRGIDIADYLAKQKITGSPAQRLSKIKAVYNNMEDRVSQTIAKSGVAIPKDQILQQVRSATRDFVDDPLALPEVERAIKEFEEFLQKKNTYAIPLSQLNEFKRSIFQRAFAKNAADVVNVGRYAVGTQLRKILTKEVPDLQKLNDEYSLIIAARRALSKAATRNQSGLLTRGLATGVGAAAGGTLGGFFGASVGGVAAERLANTLATPVRSYSGAATQTLGDVLSKIPVDEAGNIPVKLLIQALTGEEDD